MDRQKMDGCLSWVEQRDHLGFRCISKLLFLKHSAGKNSRGKGAECGPPNP